MNFNLNKDTKDFLKIILKNAQEKNLRVFFVGGIVRDNLLNIKTSDIDLLILGNAIEFAKSIENNEIKIKSIHKDFNTVKLEYKKIQIDIASSRSEIYPHSGCLPVIQDIGVKLEKDVLRRDFSINSIYCELKLVQNKISYELIDLVDGIKDIKNKTIKVLHNKSYIDDPTRIIRGVEFKHRFDFHFDLNDEKLIENYIKNIDYGYMSTDRNAKVIQKALNSIHQNKIFEEIIEKKYYKIINKDEININFNKINKIIDKLNLNKDEKSKFYFLILQNLKIKELDVKNDIEIIHNLTKLSKANLAYHFYKINDKNIEKFYLIKEIKPQINGKDLLNNGYSQGLTIGKMLDELWLKKLTNSNTFVTKSDELNWILKNFPKN